MKDSFINVRTDKKSPIWDQCIMRQTSLYDRDNSIRSEFERDYTRLMHCRAFSRLKHKTQVFYAPHNDHVCTRMEHVMHVESVSRTIAKYLGLNTELTSAIAIGHDIGHAPFGHTGEDILNSLIKYQKEGLNAPKKFWHERNSLFLADYIETLSDPDGNLKNLDLTYAVRDGLICHCGEIDQKSLKPRSEAMNLYDIKRPGYISPYTWEACIVKISDKIAFLGRDIEDARTYHIIDMAGYRQLREIVSSTLGFSQDNDRIHRSGKAVNTTVLINDMIVDLCNQSNPDDGFNFSEPYFNFIRELKSFCFANIYNHWRLVEFTNYAKVVLGGIYNTLMQLRIFAINGTMDKTLRYAPNLSQSFLSWLIKYTNYKPRGNENAKEKLHYQTKEVFDVNDEESFEKCVIEYISGMTDQYAINIYEEIISF